MLLCTTSCFSWPTLVLTWSWSGHVDYVHQGPTAVTAYVSPKIQNLSAQIAHSLRVTERQTRALSSWAWIASSRRDSCLALCQWKGTARSLILAETKYPMRMANTRDCNKFHIMRFTNLCQRRLFHGRAIWENCVLRAGTVGCISYDLTTQMNMASNRIPIIYV